ncbi:hydrogenase maturation protease [Phytoactinopolyspora limicola]|uniref:hydrogenase maturation protease n=1 Tax=Phytoactinopolyspora limicola TaxID=2715536 RepID=UPI001A9CA8E3|nr:hydrogenase maturation protease [Phytoactinopolyspora limicola]
MTRPDGPAVVIIGVGNTYRHDDDAGPAAVRILRRRALPNVTLAITDGEPTRLLELWSGADLAVVIDAVHNDPARPGRLHRVDVDRPVVAPRQRSSSHGLGLGEAVELALALDRMPRRLVLLAVEGAAFSVGQGLTAAVSRSLNRVVELVVDEVARYTPAPG